MSLNDARIALYTYVSENFSAAAIAFRGDDQRAEALDNGTDPWIFIDINWGGEFKKTMGSPNVRFLQMGVLMTKLYVRKEDGDGVLDQKTDAFMTAMRTKQIGNITTTEIGLGPKQFTKKWAVKHITVSFQVVNVYPVLPVQGNIPDDYRITPHEAQIMVEILRKHDGATLTPELDIQDRKEVSRLFDKLIFHLGILSGQRPNNY